MYSLHCDSASLIYPSRIQYSQILNLDKLSMSRFDSPEFEFDLPVVKNSLFQYFIIYDLTSNYLSVAYPFLKNCKLFQVLEIDCNCWICFGFFAIWKKSTELVFAKTCLALYSPDLDIIMFAKMDLILSYHEQMAKWGKPHYQSQPTQLRLGEIPVYI